VIIDSAIFHFSRPSQFEKYIATLTIAQQTRPHKGLGLRIWMRREIPDKKVYETIYD
jgi:hypothetical protein